MDTPIKRCKDCREMFPATPEYFQPDPKYKSGITPRCRPCHLVYHKNGMQKWRLDNPERSRSYQRQYRAKNPERIKQFELDRYARDGAKRKQWQREFRRDHPDKYKACIAKSRDTPRGIMLAKIAGHRSRSRKADLPATFTDKDWQQCLSYWNYTCAICNRPIGLWHTLAQDHWIPLTKGGGYTRDNIIPLCHGLGGCNNSKWNKDAEQWLIDKFGKRKAKHILARVNAYFDSVI